MERSSGFMGTTKYSGCFPFNRPGRTAAASSASDNARHSSPTAMAVHSIGWADNPTCPDCMAANHTVYHLFSCPTDLGPVDMWVAPFQVAQFWPFTIRQSAPLQIDLYSFPPQPSFLPLALYSLRPPMGPLHLHKPDLISSGGRNPLPYPTTSC